MASKLDRWWKAIEGKDLEYLEKQGDVETCQACGRKSAYAYDVVEAFEDDGMGHIGMASGDEWTCGHADCRAHHVARDSPILAECFTHVRIPTSRQLREAFA